MEEEQNKQDQTTAQSEPQEENTTLRYDLPPARRSGSKFVWLVLALVIVAVVVGGFMFLGNRGNEEEETAPSPTPTEVVTPTPTSPPSGTPTPTSKPSPTEKPSPTPTKKPTKGLSVKVLNGSGVIGAAKQAADYLSSLGYEIVNVGNADTTDLEKTVINIKKAKESLLAQLKIDLETKYSLGTTSATLSATESADSVVTVGKK